MQCPKCGNEMMATWDLGWTQISEYPNPDNYVNKSTLVPRFECLHEPCGFWFHVAVDEEMMAWVQAMILGEGAREDNKEKAA